MSSVERFRLSPLLSFASSCLKSVDFPRISRWRLHTIGATGKRPTSSLKADSPSVKSSGSFSEPAGFVTRKPSKSMHRRFSRSLQVRNAFDSKRPTRSASLITVVIAHQVNAAFYFSRNYMRSRLATDRNDVHEDRDEVVILHARNSPKCSTNSFGTGRVRQRRGTVVVRGKGFSDEIFTP